MSCVAASTSLWRCLPLLLLVSLCLMVEKGRAQLLMASISPGENQAVRNGQEAVFSCSINDPEGVANVTWTFYRSGGNSSTLVQGMVSMMLDENTTTNEVRIPMASPDNAGIYNCSILVNGTLVDSDALELFVITINSVNDVTVSPGNTAIFFCNASGHDNLMYSWTLYPAGASVTSNGATLEISRVSRSNFRNGSAEVVCSVSVLGMPIGTANGTLEILSARIITNPSPQTAMTGDTVEFNCTAENSPGASNPLTFRWNGIEEVDGILPPSTNNVTNLTTSVLRITGVMRGNAGDYTCLVSNFGLADEVSSVPASLTVLFVPVIDRIEVEVSGEALPRTTNGQYQADANVLTNVLNGSADAVPNIMMALLYRIDEDGNRTEVFNCSLPSINLFNCFLPYLSINESGAVFKVVVGNGLGNVSTTVVLLVQDVPGPVNVSLVGGEVVDLLRVRLTWATPIDNNAAITGYVVSFCLVDDDNMTTCSSSLNQSVSGGTPSLELTHGAPLNSNIRVTEVVASNRVGMGTTVGGPVDVAVATTANARPTAVSTFAVTESFAVVVWELPPTARGSDIQANFTATVTNGSSTVAMLTTNGTAIFLNSRDLIAPGRNVSVVVRATYQNPPGEVAVAPVFTFTVPQMDAVRPLLQMGTITPTLQSNSIQISWPPPPTTDFLEGFSVTVASQPIITVPARRKKRATAPVTRMFDRTATSSDTFTVTPHSTVDAMVNAVYAGGGQVPLVPSQQFTSPQAAPSAPRSLELVRNGHRSLNCSWLIPDPPNGVIMNYIVRYNTKQVVVGAVTSISLGNLETNTDYTITVAGFTISEGPPSDGRTLTTTFGVAQPMVSVQRTIENTVFRGSITVSRIYGAVKVYHIVVTRRPLDGTTNMVDLKPYSQDNRDVYVTRVGTLDTQQSTASFDIGTGSMVTIDGVIYVNQNLSGNTDYYIFVRVFSSIDPSVFNDSSLSSMFRYDPGINVGAVIGSIAAVAVVLVIILVVLLIVAYFTLASPSSSKSILRGEKKSRSGIMEMRRTRVFSPVLNVEASDVVTAAGQPTTLICEASGTPAPTVTWSRGGESLDKERFIQLADGSLFVNDTDLQDEGMYMVQAENSAGDQAAHIRLFVAKPSPPEADPDHDPLKVGEFSEKIALLRLDEGLEDEYEDVEPDINLTSYIAKMNINKNKNRYINIIPYDHSRVVLSLQDSTPGSDYINASFIDAYQRPNGYIASQGPMPSTFPDFWRMIWELDTPTIVMVTNLSEDDKIKCHQYWPSYGSQTYGNIQVTLKEVENLAEYTIRTFNVTPLAGQSRVQMPVREVRQFHFLVWPDHGVPAYATNLLSFRKRVLKYHPEKRGPMVVHCSAGVGRTGTFITIDFMLKQMEAEGTINIFNFVRHMRYRRNYMVQTSSQYVFIHDALLESIMCGDNSIKAPELKKKVEELRQVVPETGVSGFETQFKTLEAASPSDEDFDCTTAQLPENAFKNKSKSHVPANDVRVVLSTDNKQSDYICASYVDNYRERNAFIVTQGPLEETVNDFWRMIWETKSAAIVMLTELEEDGQEMCLKYWPSGKDETKVFGGFQVQLTESEKNKGDYITRKFKLSPVSKSKESHIVSQFHFIRWTKTTPPRDCQPMLDLIDELQRVQRKSGNMPITVHCDDGIGRTGAFCTLYSVMERVKTEQIVDVFQACKTLRIQRTGLMATVREYEFVHFAVISYIETFSEYQNFK